MSAYGCHNGSVPRERKYGTVKFAGIHDPLDAKVSTPSGSAVKNLMTSKAASGFSAPALRPNTYPPIHCAFSTPATGLLNIRVTPTSISGKSRMIRNALLGVDSIIASRPDVKRLYAGGMLALRAALTGS